MRHPSRHHLQATVVGTGAFVVFGVVTGLIPNPFYVRMVPRTPLDYLFLGLTAVFLGVYTLQRSAGRRTDEKKAGATVVLGFLAFGCPICNAFLLALFSSSALMTYFDALRPLVGAVSVGLFAGLLYVRSQRSCGACNVEVQEASTKP
jgi:predicted transporter